MAEQPIERAPAQTAAPLPRAARRKPTGALPIAEQMQDVWSRSAPRDRVRALVFLALALLLFCGLCVFTHWLHRFRLFEFTLESYAAPINFWNKGSPNLYDFVLDPIDVTQTPVHAIVLGLLLASIFAVPIAIAILYRLPFAVPFVAAVAAFAHMPWLALTLLGSCVLASVRPFRLPFQFGSALVGMLPILLYLLLATRGGTDQLDQASPTHRALMAAPWILSILLACAMNAIVLLVSRAVNYRPTVIPPVLAIMFATPVFLFHARVGADELLFRVLAKEYGPQSARFAAVSDARPALREMLRRLVLEDEAFARFSPEVLSALSGKSTPLQRVFLNQLQSEFLTQRSIAHEAFERFQSDFPASRYMPAILYMHAYLMDLRMEERAFESREPRRELYADFPRLESEPYWARLLTGSPRSGFAAVAALRLAQLNLRRGGVDDALRALDQALLQSEPTTAPAPQGAMAALFRQPSLEAALEFDPRPYRREVRNLAALIRANRDDPGAGNAPLLDFASLDPRRPRYREQIARLADQYRATRLYDNLLLEWALAAPESTARMDLLNRILVQTPVGDARAELLFRLAELEFQNENPEVQARGQQRLHELADADADLWSENARSFLRRVGVAASDTMRP